MAILEKSNMVKCIIFITLLGLQMLDASSQERAIRDTGILISLADRIVFFSTKHKDIEKFLGSAKDSGVAVPYSHVVGLIMQSSDSLPVVLRTRVNNETTTVDTLMLRYTSVMLKYSITGQKFYNNTCSFGFDRDSTDYYFDYYFDAGFLIIDQIKPVRRVNRK